MAASFPSDYFSYDDFDYEPVTPDCGDPWEDMESLILLITLMKVMMRWLIE